jgi:4-hydroxymandelate oxidase
VENLRAMTRLPLVLKGILHPDDAERAAELGVAALVVSNHGGRNLDSGLSPIEALPPIVDRLGGKVPLLEMAMALVGCASIASIDHSALFPTPAPR